MSGHLYFDSYDSGLGREQMLCVGDGTRRLLIIPPLFDEMNRMRRTLVMAMHLLADHGVSSILPDLPGQNESAIPLSQCRLSDWHAALLSASQVSKVSHVVSLRSACVLDNALADWPRWRNSAIGGERVVTHLVRTQLASDKGNGLRTTRADYQGEGAADILELAGYSIGSTMVRDLNEAVLSPLDGPTDRTITQSLGPALWLRAEPGESADFAHNLASEWAKWVAA